MTQRMRVRPTKAATVIGLIAAVALLIFGIFFLIAVTGDSGGEPGPAIGFMILWFLIVGLIIVYGIYNLKSRRGVIEIETDPVSEPSESPSRADFDAKLRKLEGLKKDGLVTDLEYQTKRAEIIAEKW